MEIEALPSQTAARHSGTLLIFGTFTHDPTSGLARILAARVAREFLHDVCVGAG